jgi:hypothetical protein
MASPFDDLDALVSASVGSAFGEAAIITPRVSQQYAARAQDTNRASLTCHGVLSAGPADASVKGQTVGGEFAGATRIASTRADLATLGYIPARGDLVSFPTRTGSPAYAVSALQHTDLGDLTLILVAEDQPS